MAAEAIPLINSLLASMGLTAAGSAKGKKYDIPQRYSKKEQKKDIEAHIKRMTDDPYDSLSEEEKKKLAKEANETVGFGGDPDNNNNKDNKDKAAAGAAASGAGLQVKKNAGWHLDADAVAKGERKSAAKEARKDWGRELIIDESSIMGGSKHAKSKGMSDPEAVQISRENFMEGQPNSLDTDKAVSELKGQKKSALRNRSVMQDASDILEHHKAPEDTRMTNKALSDEGLNDALGIVKSIGKKTPALLLGALAANLKESSPVYGADAMEVDAEDFLKEMRRFALSDDPKDRKIFNQMFKDYLKDNDLTENELLEEYSKSIDNKEPTWEEIKPIAESLINSDNEEDRKKGHELIEKYYLDDKDNIAKESKSEGKGLKGLDLY